MGLAFVALNRDANWLRQPCPPRLKITLNEPRSSGSLGMCGLALPPAKF